MTNKNNDVSTDGIDRPDDKHENEIFDLVLRKGPITFDDLMGQISTYSDDEVARYLSSLEEQGYVAEKECETEYNWGTLTSEKWCVETDMEESQ